MESQLPPPGPASAREALDSITETRARIADRLVTPRWYHPILGAILGAIVLSPSIPRPWNTIVIALAAAGIALLVQSYRRRTGVWVGGFSLPRARRWAWLLAIVAVGCFLVGLAAADARNYLVAAVAAGVAAVAVMVIGPRSDAAVRADLRRGE
jgi:hypothetical protein